MARSAALRRGSVSNANPPQTPTLTSLQHPKQNAPHRPTNESANNANPQPTTTQTTISTTKQSSTRSGYTSQQPIPTLASPPIQRAFTRSFKKKKHYAVARGRTTGIFPTWDQCQPQIDGHRGAMFKSFVTKEEAIDYMHENAPPGDHHGLHIPYGSGHMDYTHENATPRDHTGMHNPSDPGQIDVKTNNTSNQENNPTVNSYYHLPPIDNNDASTTVHFQTGTKTHTTKCPQNNNRTATHFPPQPQYPETTLPDNHTYFHLASPDDLEYIGGSSLLHESSTNPNNKTTHGIPPQAQNNVANKHSTTINEKIQPGTITKPADNQLLNNTVNNYSPHNATTYIAPPQIIRKLDSETPTALDYRGANNPAQIYIPQTGASTSTPTAPQEAESIDTPPHTPVRTTPHQTTTSNNQQNRAFGDDINTRHTVCRIILQNINGLQNKARQIASRATELHVNIIGLIETNKDWEWQDTKFTTTSAMRRYFERSSFAFSSSAHTFDSTAQPGGTATITIDKWGSRSKPSSDPREMGRWSTQHIQGKAQQSVTIFTVYRVCDQTFATSGPRTAFRQQYMIAATLGINPNNPRQQLLSDLGDAITTERSKSHEIIVLIDANESIGKHNSKFSTWINRMALVDPITTRHGPAGQPPSLDTGSSRIDFILISRALQPFVKAAGILPRFHFADSDHRALFIDIDLEDYLQGIPTDTTSRSHRGITSDNPKAVAKYQELLTKALDKSTAECDLETLALQSAHTPLTEAQQQQVSQIDLTIANMRVEAESKCRHIRNVPWSPRLTALQAIVCYWESWRNQPQCRTDGTEYRTRLCPNLPQKPTPSTQMINSSLREAKQNFKSAERDAALLREEHMQELAKFYANTGKVSISTMVKQIHHREKSKNLFLQCKIALRKPIPKPITSVILTSPGGNKTSIFDREPMETALTHRNRTHFSQADGTPFTAYPLVTTYGPYGTKSPTTRLLNGTIEVPTYPLSEATTTLLQNLPLANAPPIDGRMYPEELMKGYTVWREGTSTSPFGDHLGHDKAILKQLKQAQPTVAPTYHISHRVFNIRAKILNLALDNGIVLERWTDVLTTMIEKDPGNPEIERFRVILIIPSDFNMMTGILFGHRLMQQGERLLQFGEEQSGSRQGKDCQDVQLFKHCIYSIIRLTRANGSTFDNDAKSCFDRIVMLFPSILAQRLGMPANVCHLFLKTLANIQYRTKTTHGTSEATYSTTLENTIHGPGQGSKAAPAIWTIVSCYLLSQMHIKSQGVTICDPEQTIQHHQSSSGFVDDITHWNIHIRNSLLGPETKEELQISTQTTAQWWENLLYSSGGTLELKKCFYYMFHWQFSNTGMASLSLPVEFPEPVKLRNSITETETAIENKACTQSHKTLGKLENPSGNYDNEANRIKSKADDMAKHVTASALSEEAAGTLYSSMYINSICYGFASGCMSLAQAEKAQSAFTTAILQPLGYNRNTPRKVVYAESNKGGAGLRHLFPEQGTRQTKALLYHMRKQTKMGDTLLINLKWAQRVCGTSKPILSEPSRRLPHIGAERWMITLRQFLHLSELGIQINKIPVAPPKRTHDRHIMDVATDNESYTNRTIKAINACRVYLQVTTISDVTDASGTSITNDASTCRRSTKGSQSLWPRQPRPTNIAPWKLFLNSICTTTPGTLDQPLGEWTSNPHERDWDSYYDKTHQMVLTFTNNQWKYTLDIVKMTNLWQIGELSRYHSQTIRKSQDLIPERLYSTYGILHISIPMAHLHMQTPPPQSWTQYMNSLAPWEHNLIKNTNINNHTLLRQGLESMKPEPLFIVSDGSYKEGNGAFSWILADGIKVLAENTDIVTGNPITPMRTECTAILSWILFLSRYSDFRNIAIKATIQPYTDCKLTLKYMSTSPIPPKENSPIRPDYDITNEIHHRFGTLHSNCNFLLSGQYVKGHQKKPFPTRQSMLNHTCDSNAKAGRQMQTTQPFHKLPQCHAYLTSDNDYVTGDEMNMCRWKWRNIILFQYFEQKFNLDPDTVKAIHWDAYAKAKSQLPPALKRFVTKLTIRWLPSANRLKLFGNEIDKCHLCPLEETNNHIYQCSHRIPDFHVRHAALQKFLRSIDTPAAASTAIATGILNWALKATAPTNEAFSLTLPIETAKCYNRQTTLGWDLATFGLMDSHWCRLIPRATDNTSRTQWQAKVTKWLLESAQGIWKNRNSERNTIDPETQLNAQRRETDAKLTKVYELATEHLTPYDHHELIKETLEQRRSLPEPTNRIWVNQIQRLIYQRIRHNRTRPPLTDIRKFFPPPHRQIRYTKKQINKQPNHH